MATHSYKAGLRAVFDVQGRIVDYVPIEYEGKKIHPVSRQALIDQNLQEQARNFLESVAGRGDIQDLTLKLDFTTLTPKDKCLVENLKEYIAKKFMPK